MPLFVALPLFGRRLSCLFHRLRRCMFGWAGLGGRAGLSLGVGLWSRWSRNRCGDGRSALAFFLSCRWVRTRRRGSSRGGGSLRGTTALGRRRWRRWGRWRRQRLQKFQSLGSRAQLPVQQQHEDIIGNLRIFRQLWRNVQLRHLRQWNLLLYLAPFGEEILDLLLDTLLPGRDRQKQHHFRPCIR